MTPVINEGMCRCDICNYKIYLSYNLSQFLQALTHLC